MSTPLDQVRSAVVTGGARGIGRAVGEQLVRRGYRVVLTDVDEAAVRRTADEIGAAVGLVQDVRDEDSHVRVAEEAARHGRLAVWVNNAGVGDDGTLAELSSGAVSRLVEINLLGTVWGMRAAVEAFGSAGGDVVNIASLSGLGPVPGLSLYAATKAGVVSLTTSVNAETPRRTRIHALCPDGVATDLVAGMRPDGQAKALVHSGGGLLSPEEVAAEAVGLVGSSRVVRTLPGWRGGLMRTSALLPGVAAKGMPLFVALGRRIVRSKG